MRPSVWHRLYTVRLKIAIQLDNRTSISDQDQQERDKMYIDRVREKAMQEIAAKDKRIPGTLMTERDMEDFK